MARGKEAIGLSHVPKNVTLIAQSPRNAFYELTLERIREGFLVRKASGGNGKIYNREAWFRENLDEEEKTFVRILNEKTNPQRRRPRKYLVASQVCGLAPCREKRR